MTPYSDVFDSFRGLLIRDDRFFKEPPKEILEVRMVKLLKHAVTNMMLVKDKRDFEINFMSIMDDALMQFNEELTLLEIDLLAYFMWQCYIEEEVVVRLRELKNIGFRDDEIAAFSPSGTVKEFRSTYNLLVHENINRVKEYKRRGRLDFKLKTHKFRFGEE